MGKIFYIEQTADINGNVVEGNGTIDNLVEFFRQKSSNMNLSTREARIFYHYNPMEEAEEPEEIKPKLLTAQEMRMRDVQDEQLRYAKSQLTKEERKMLKEERYQDTTEVHFQKVYANAQMNRKEIKEARRVMKTLESENKEIHLCYNGSIYLNGETDIGVDNRSTLYIPLTSHKFVEERVYVNAEDEFQHTMPLPEDPTEPNLEIVIVHATKRIA